MSASESDYNQSSASISADEQPIARSRRGVSNAPTPSRKRRRSRSRSESLGPLRNAKRHLDGQYNDAYRTLFNENVTSAATRFDLTDPFYHDYSHPLQGQIGLSKWTLKEKSTFYAALERFGQDDVRGIAGAIGTKSIPETRELLLILRDASAKHGDMRLTLRDIPAAVEVSPKCNERLELAGDALAWYQERFEAKQEWERFGDYWLITPEIADKIEDALKSSRQSSVVSRSTPGLEDEGGPPLKKDTEILQDIPESNLLHLSNLLTLSSSVFMNCSPDLPSPSPHWSTIVSPLAAKPSIYRTAIIDFHTLVISLTKRLTQASIIQATSRIRSQSWRLKKGVSLLVKKRDVFTAIDMLGLKRDGRETWRGVARRCGLQVIDGTGKSKREVDWNEVEKILARSERFVETGDTDVETTGLDSGAEENDFKARAVRSGTPLPPERLESSECEQRNDIDIEYEDKGSDSDESLVSGSSTFSKAPRASPEFGLNTLEEFDRETSRNEELRMWTVIGTAAPSSKEGFRKDEDVIEEERELEASNKIITSHNNWRNWTDYHAEWEDLHTPVPPAKFRTNQKSSPSYPLSIGLGDTDYETQPNHSSDADEQFDSRRKKRRRTSEHEIPIRGARAYAALQEERISVSEDRDAYPVDSDDDTKMPAQSIEDEDT
ncbi:hypothetical protein K505DRAFT_325474 [Melanomma pulvis-pyrius CBS 109.77]|uniref:Myb-like domain-containing protein n=1 Tax=Melanomma pulvis-pyrius CBS 109.77 TaxID=1314802 RepID=A0A6A6XA79_9PLEO|nr:hypothetical protein K505DRAFT_325474 [Melanomma pulvis-pyrius CBS 109.77]